MLTAIKGTFRNGRVDLDENPLVEGDVEVVVTFLTPVIPSDDADEFTFGMLAGSGPRMSTLDDFRVGEWVDPDPTESAASS